MLKPLSIVYKIDIHTTTKLGSSNKSVNPSFELCRPKASRARNVGRCPNIISVVLLSNTWYGVVRTFPLSWTIDFPRKTEEVLYEDEMRTESSLSSCEFCYSLSCQAALACSGLVPCTLTIDPCMFAAVIYSAITITSTSTSK